MNINVEYKCEKGFPVFFSSVAQKKVSVMFDVNTKPFAKGIINELKEVVSEIIEIEFLDEELVPSEDKCDYAFNLAKNSDYLLAVGSGTLNDMAKSVSTRLSIDCGVLATAASMDGYCSKGSALMRDGVKVTDEVHCPKDVLIDLQIISNAPKIMTAAGFGDILGKYTSLTDWQMANAVKGEPIHAHAFELMQSAVNECIALFSELTKYSHEAIAKLMDALIVAGLSMAECGNSRPASGSEHHQSHFLEMDFVRRGEKIPMHGIKVAIGTLVSVELYNYLRDNKISFNGCERVFELVEKLPSVETLKSMLEKMGAPTKFSQIGVRRETMEKMIESAYTVRDRYTVLTLINELNLTEKVKPIIMEKYF